MKPCKSCGLEQYQHVDHHHVSLVDRWGRCPFGDCGNYKPSEDV